MTINAMTLFTFGLGNIVGTEIFLPADAPSYIPGKVAVLVLWCLSLVVTLILRTINIRLNKVKKQRLAEIKQERGWSDEDLERERDRHAFLDMTDKQCAVFIQRPDES